jgi:outer membrane lipoprotein-sorting protein
MRKWLSTSRALLPMLAPVFGVTLFAAAQADQAKDVITQVTKALGGDAKVAAIKTLSAEGTYRRVFGENEMSGDLELYLGLPDKFQRVEQMGARPDGMPGMRIGTTYNGTEGWMGPLGPVPGGMMFRMGGGPGGPGGPGGGPGGAAGPGGQRFDPTQRVKTEFLRTALALLPVSSATSGLTFTYVGKAEAPDGQADVLEAKGDGNFTARLFVDANSHLPIMITYMDRDQSRMFRMATQRGPQNETEEQRRARFEEERKRREAEGPPPMVEYSWFLADYKKVDGVQLPHRFTLQVGDKPSQEWEIKKFKINPTLDAEQFKKKTSN